MRKRTIVYILQGGGALGSYQVGVYKALEEHGYHPDWVTGISIGAINAAIIAGNPKHLRLKKLNEFWDVITTNFFHTKSEGISPLMNMQNLIGAHNALLFGQSGFFKPRVPNPWFIHNATPDQISFYDTTQLKETLKKFVDFQYLNEKHVRLSLGASDVESGQLVYFDNTEEEIGVEHIMASSALPPGFPAVKIKNRFYWDGGVYSNTPLTAIIDKFDTKAQNVEDLLCFMVDLFSATGYIPHSLEGVLERSKEIQYSSHSIRFVSMHNTSQNLRKAIHALGQKMTEEQKLDPLVTEMLKLGQRFSIQVAHLIYRSEIGGELHSKDYNFSKLAARKHKKVGYFNTLDVLKRKPWDDKVGIYTADDIKIL